MNITAVATLTAFALTALVPYPLDGVSREVPKRGKLKCDRHELVKYKGDLVKYHRTTTVHPAFRDRLRRFEKSRWYTRPVITIRSCMSTLYVPGSNVVRLV